MARRTCAFAIAVLAIACGDKQRDVPAAAVAAKPSTAATKRATIHGNVIDRSDGKPVGDVEVVLRGAGGETKATAAANGTFELSVEPGAYRAFVRSPRVMTVGMSERVRLDNVPRRELAGAIDEALLPVLDVERDIPALELTVMPAASLTGTAVDANDNPVADAIVRIRSFDREGLRPVLGSDLAITDAQGNYKLSAPPGSYLIDAAHPSFAGILGNEEVELRPGARTVQNVVLERGCIISGRVVNPDGSPANDGAIERLGANVEGFGPAGRIIGGAFRWTTAFDGSVTLRAWPWRSPPSGSKTFECKDGKRFTDVVLRLPDQRPDLSGVVVDSDDLPVPLAYLDVTPLDPNVVTGQQERGDAAANWHVYDMPAGRYRITGSAPGHGVVDQIVLAPKQDIRLQLGGTGRIVGTATELVTGSVEVTLKRCGSEDQPLVIAHEPRIVPVVAGRFTIERAPACTLTVSMRWRDQALESSVVVEPDRTAYLEVELGAPREKTVTGVVRDTGGQAIEGARVTAVLQEREAETVRTDASGRYTIKTHSGAQLVAGKGEHSGRGLVGRANVANEKIDLVLDDAGY